MGHVVALADPFTALVQHAFFRNAVLAGTGIALCSGLVGWFVVLRGQVFTGDALSHVAFTGALAALALGLDLRLGLFVATLGVAVGLGRLGRSGRRPDDVVIGAVFAWVLGLGVLFLSIFTTEQATGQASAGTAVLFGSILGLSTGQAWLALAIGLGVSLVLVAIARPLLFASVDGAVAAARGVPVAALGYSFLLLVGATAAEATQAVGALLLLGLLAAPAGAAQRLCTRPWAGLATSAAIAVGAVWSGLGLSYVFGDLPPSFTILAVTTAAYLAAAAWDGLARPARRRRSRRASARQDPTVSVSLSATT